MSTLLFPDVPVTGDDALPVSTLRSIAAKLTEIVREDLGAIAEQRSEVDVNDTVESCFPAMPTEPSREARRYVRDWLLHDVADHVLRRSRAETMYDFDRLGLVLDLIRHKETYALRNLSLIVS